MAATETKFCLSRIVLSAAVFISLSVLTYAKETRRCFWCGPLAEQVHRSRRASSCDSAYRDYSQVTVCDPGFPYCAIVATSPPYVESRYCVKVYQDECYSLYCNSTKTWRMTCPCRGDLCNGPNIDRENEAFELLNRIVAKTHNTRNKRALISTSGFISLNPNRKNRVDNTTADETKNQQQNETTGNNTAIDVMNTGDTNSEPTTPNEGNEKIVHPPAEDSVDNEKSNKDIDTTPTVTEKNGEEQMTNTNTMSSSDKPTEKPSITYNTEKTERTKDYQTSSTVIQIDIPNVSIDSSDFKTEIIVMSSETSHIMEPRPTISVSSNQDITKPEIQKTPMLSDPKVETSTLPTMPTEALKAVANKVKPSEQLPTAEALQHNETPATTTEMPMTMSTQGKMTTATTSTQYTVAPTAHTTPKNNTALRIEPHVLTLVIGIMIHI